MQLNLHEFECFWVFSLWLVSSFRSLWSEKMLDMISIFLNLLRLVLCPIMWSIFENVPWAFEKNVYFASLGWKALHISVNSSWSRTLFNSTISLLIFCLEDLAFFDSSLWKSPTIIVLLSISFLKSSKIFFMYLFQCSFVGCLYMYNVYVFLMDSSFEYYEVTFWVSLYAPSFWSLFCLI